VCGEGFFLGSKLIVWFESEQNVSVFEVKLHLNGNSFTLMKKPNAAYEHNQTRMIVGGNRNFSEFPF
jgi:hypothetical protein